MNRAEILKIKIEIASSILADELFAGKYRSYLRKWNGIPLIYEDMLLEMMLRK